MILKNHQSNGVHMMDTTQSSPSGQSENLFLKRKLDQSNETVVEIDAITNNGEYLSSEIVSSPSVMVSSSSDCSFQPMCKKQNLDQNESMATIDGFSQNFTEDETNNHNYVNFGLIGNVFMNDLFSYESNVVVPISLPSTVQSTISTELSTNTVNGEQNFVDDGSNWQAEDLLELDHRYNSGLQSNRHENDENNEQMQEQTHIDQQQQHIDYGNHRPISKSPLSSCSIGSHHRSYQRRRYSNSSCYSSVGKVNTLQQFTTNNTITTDVNSESDFEDKNLSWLFNFKLDELPYLSPDIGNQLPTATKTSGGNFSKIVSSTPRERSKSPKVSASKVGRKFEELVMEVTAETEANETICCENMTTDENILRMPKKPPFTYTELIEYALEDKGELTVSGIYQWISDRFPFYKSNDDRWKNSVRHNLSINPHFRKGVKAPQGAGHLWTISSGDSEENVLAWEHKKQRLDLFFKMESIHRERIKQIQNECDNLGSNTEQSNYDETATAVATIRQEMLSEPTIENPSCHANVCERLITRTHELPFNDLISDEELRKTAGQILNGIHRNVEVQSVNSIVTTYQDNILDSDYLNPVGKVISAPMSGNDIQNNATSSEPTYYVAEIEPAELDVTHMTHQVEEEVLFSDEFNLNYFGYNPGNDIVA